MPFRDIFRLQNVLKWDENGQKFDLFFQSNTARIILKRNNTAKRGCDLSDFSGFVTNI